MKYGNVLGAQVTSDASTASGGGIFGGTGVGMKYSRVSFNDSTGTPAGFGGGIYSKDALLIQNSTISGNTANFSTAGVFQAPGASYAHIYSSTISGNKSSQYVGGILVQAPDLIITNSTIAFNYGPTTGGISGAFAPGLAIFASSSTTLKFQSTIVSNNSFTATSDFDMSLNNGGAFAFDPASSNNLVRVPGNNFAVPGLTLLCPYLQPLRDNGGLTETHALASNSVAIDAGSNPKG